MAIDVWGTAVWTSTEPVSHTNLNIMRDGIREPGKGQAAGSVTVNYNQNHIAALGSLTVISGGVVRLADAAGGQACLIDNAGDTLRLYRTDGAGVPPFLLAASAMILGNASITPEIYIGGVRKAISVDGSGFVKAVNA